MVELFLKEGIYSLKSYSGTEALELSEEINDTTVMHNGGKLVFL